MLYTKKRISDLWFLSAMSNKKQRARAEKESERITSPICLCAGFKGSLSGFIGTVPQCYQCPIEFGDLGYQPFFYNPPRILALYWPSFLYDINLIYGLTTEVVVLTTVRNF